MWTKRLISFVILALCAAIAGYLINNKPEPRVKPKQAVIVSVEAISLKSRDYQIRLESYGNVQPHTQGSLISEVNGSVVEVGANFRAGRFFAEGDLLLKLDDADYRAALALAKSSLEQAKLQLHEQQARQQQAQRDWQRLGNNGEANPLTLREPQIAASRAQLSAAEAQLEQAKRDLQRTEIRAPYAGRVLSKSVDRGQFVSRGTSLGTIFASDYVEVRLPLTKQQLAFINLPHNDSSNQGSEHQPAVELFSQMATGSASWQGRIVRSDAAVDAKSRQLYVVARIDQPYAPSSDAQRSSLKIGEFVRAEIAGQRLGDVYVVPAQAVQAGQVGLIIDGKLQRRAAEIIWRGADEVVLASTGLSENVKVITSPLGRTLAGTPLVVRSLDGEVVQVPETPAKGKRSRSASDLADSKPSAKGA